MTTSELTNIELQTQPVITQNEAVAKNLFTLKVIENLLIAAFFSIIILIFVFNENQKYVIAGVISLIFLVALFVINRQVFEESKNAAYKGEISKKAELYSYLYSNSQSLDQKTLVAMKAKALQYCQELIDDYKRVRKSSRVLYYVLQLSTVIFSGVTPILVLVDKIEAGQTWLKWLPVICPAIASIVASIATSFPLEKNLIAADTAVELLEAEQEKFILGVTPPYRCYDAPDEAQQQQRITQALEYFIVQVNNIHLKQLQQGNEKPAENKEIATSSEAKPAQTETAPV